MFFRFSRSEIYKLETYKRNKSLNKFKDFFIRANLAFKREISHTTVCIACATSFAILTKQYILVFFLLYLIAFPCSVSRIFRQSSVLTVQLILPPCLVSVSETEFAAESLHVCSLLNTHLRIYASDKAHTCTDTP